MTGDPGQAKELVGGARPYLLKPFGLATLIEVIDSTVAGEMGQWDDPAYGRRITDYYTRPAP